MISDATVWAPRACIVLSWFMMASAALAQQTGAPAALVDLPGTDELKYRLIGPAWGGRTTRVAGVVGTPTMYAAAAAGGLWKSSNGGLTWEPIFDEANDASVGAFAVSPSNPNVLYVGTGEANLHSYVVPGHGIYKSEDAGLHWKHVWVQKKAQTAAIIIDPANPDVAFAAVFGDSYGPNKERGVYRTTDGGKTWGLVLSKDENTGASDVAFDPSNSKTVFAGLWQARRTPWSIESGGAGSGLYVSRDGGDNWQRLSGGGLPGGIWGKVGVQVAPSDPARVYALIEAIDGGLFRSDDGGARWSRVSASHLLRNHVFYYGRLTISPMNPDEIWVPQVSLARSIDGGHTFVRQSGLHHDDFHDVWFDPKNSERIIVAGDGGLDISDDRGKTWFSPALPLGQFYHISADNRVPFYVSGSMQDLGAVQGPSNSLDEDGIRNSDWYHVGGGEAGWILSDSRDPNIVYAGDYSGFLSLYDNRTREAQDISVYPENTFGHIPAGLRYRFQYTAPIASSPENPNTLYHRAQVLFRTQDGGKTWKAISGDLTRNDKTKQQSSGGPIKGDNIGIEYFGTLYAIAESPWSCPASADGFPS